MKRRGEPAKSRRRKMTKPSRYKPFGLRQILPTITATRQEFKS